MCGSLSHVLIGVFRMSDKSAIEWTDAYLESDNRLHQDYARL